MKSLRALFLLWAMPLYLSAQPHTDWAFAQLGIAEGLTDNNVFHIFEDSRGFVWISTQNGLNRWDGREIRTYNYNPSDTNSLSGNWINFTLEDREGFLWFGTFGGGLCRFDPRLEKFVRYKKNERPGSLNSDVITCGLQDAAGILWLGTADGGLNRFDPTTNTFTAFPKPFGQSDEVLQSAKPESRYSGPSSAHITCLLEAGADQLWVGTAFGLCRFDKRDRSFEYFLHDPQKPVSLPNNFVYNLQQSAAGDLWVKVPQKWARFDAQNLDFQIEAQFPGLPPDATQGRFWVSPNKAVWQATEQGFRYWYHHPSPFDLGLRSHYPSTVFGLKKIRTLLEHAGYLWIASEDGLFRCALGTEQLEQLLPQNFHALWADGDLVWAASKGDGLFRVEAHTGTIRHYPAATNGRGPAKGSLFALTKDAWGQLWLGSNGVLDRFEPEKEHFTSYLDRISSNPNTPGSVLSLFFDRQNRLWVGTFTEGLYLFTFDTHGQVIKAEQFRYDPKNTNSLSNDIVLAIWQDRRGALWFGTDGGLNRLPADWQSGQTALFRRYLRSDGLSDDKIMSIRDDAQGNIWIGHLSHGLSRLNPGTGELRNFGTADGLPSPLFYWSSAYQRPDGALLFGTTEGLVAFHPDSLKVQNKTSPPVFFTEILLFNKKMEIGSGEGKLPESPIFAPKFVLSHEQNSLTFRFAALNFIHPELNCFAFRLEPLDEEWHDLGTRNEVSLSHLPPGNYTLRIKAANNEGVENGVGASIQFRIRPPWWQTNWAYLLYVMLLGAGIWLLLRAQVRAAKQKLWLHFGQTLASVESNNLPNNSGPAFEFLRELYKLLEKHLADEYFSVEQMAKELALSRTQLHRKTIEVTGYSAGQLLQNLRLEHARHLLAETNLSVGEIAFQCGFSDPNYFSRLFSKTQGMTPTEFAQQARA